VLVTGSLWTGNGKLTQKTFAGGNLFNSGGAFSLRRCPRSPIVLIPFTGKAVFFVEPALLDLWGLTDEPSLHAVIADETQLILLFQSLVGNAIKYQNLASLKNTFPPFATGGIDGHSLCRTMDRELILSASKESLACFRGCTNGGGSQAQVLARPC
jgi:hypothetical protein